MFIVKLNFSFGRRVTEFVGQTQEFWIPSLLMLLETPVSFLQIKMSAVRKAHATCTAKLMSVLNDSHLWLEVNGLQTSTLKLHHCLEAFVVLGLKPHKQTPRLERGKTHC